MNVAWSESKEFGEAERELIQRGLSSKVAANLVQTYPIELIGMYIEVFDWLRKQGYEMRNPPGYLHDSIRRRYRPPLQFEEERRKRSASIRKPRRKIDVIQRQRDTASRWKEVEKKLQVHSPKELQAIVEQAAKQAPPILAAMYERNREDGGPTFERVRRMLLERHFLADQMAA